MTAYVIFLRERTTDPVELATYAEMAPKAAPGHPITPLVLYGVQQTLEGDPFEGVAAFSFPSVEEARAWFDSPLYQEAAAHRRAGSDYRILIVEGLAS